MMPMGRCSFVTGGLVVCLVLAGGCSSAPSRQTGHPRMGPKTNVGDFGRRPGAYKGKSITLDLRVEEAIDRDRGRSLRDYAGRDVKFTTAGTKGERLKLVITIPSGLEVPEVGHGDEVTVTFVCARGSLRQGNEAKIVRVP
jgi:hypothetical protein